jgi:hypothetical protein
MKFTVIMVLVITFLFLVGCDPGNGGDVFTTSTNETISNDIGALGVVGTSVSSSNENILTAEITTSGKIKITSISEGVAEITVSNDDGYTAKISITVSASGVITIGNIVKFNPFVETWIASIGSGVTLACEHTIWTMTLGEDDDHQTRGTYTYTLTDGSYNGTFKITHIKDPNNQWQWTDQIPADTDEYKPSIVWGFSAASITSLPADWFTGTISGNQLITTTGAGTFNKAP